MDLPRFLSGLSAYGILISQATPMPGMPEGLWTVATHYGFPAVLVVFLLWAWNRRDEKQLDRMASTEDFVRKELLNSLTTNVIALKDISAALDRFSASTAAGQRETHELTQKVSQLIIVFGEHVCPFQTGHAQQVANDKNAD